MRFPIVTSLPGGQSTFSRFDIQGGIPASAEFVDKSGTPIAFVHSVTRERLPRILISDADRCLPLAYLCPWPGVPDLVAPAPYPKIFSIYWIAVPRKRLGIGSALHVYAHLMLNQAGLRLAPAEAVLADGVELWRRLDPGIEWEPPDDGGSAKPDLRWRTTPAI